MGFNISGIAISKNYQNNPEELFKQLGWDLKFSQEITFDTASENWKDEAHCDIYFTNNGTILFLNPDLCSEPWCLENVNVLTFSISETAMIFLLNYCEGKEIRRSFMEKEGIRMKGEGNRLPAEETSKDASQVIWKQIEEVTGKSFFEIKAEEKAYRYNFR
jgi:hypothetical protein